MHREPDVGFDPGSPGSRLGPKAGAKPLRHPGIPVESNLMERSGDLWVGMALSGISLKSATFAQWIEEGELTPVMGM